MFFTFTLISYLCFHVHLQSREEDQDGHTVQEGGHSIDLVVTLDNHVAEKEDHDGEKLVEGLLDKHGGIAEKDIHDGQKVVMEVLETDKNKADETNDYNVKKVVATVSDNVQKQLNEKVIKAVFEKIDQDAEKARKAMLHKIENNTHQEVAKEGELNTPLTEVSEVLCISIHQYMFLKFFNI